MPRDRALFLGVSADDPALWQGDCLQLFSMGRSRGDPRKSLWSPSGWLCPCAKWVTIAQGAAFSPPRAQRDASVCCWQGFKTAGNSDVSILGPGGVAGCNVNEGDFLKGTSPGPGRDELEMEEQWKRISEGQLTFLNDRIGP